jgi:hypothetical protein
MKHALVNKVHWLGFGLGEAADPEWLSRPLIKGYMYLQRFVRQLVNQ